MTIVKETLIEELIAVLPESVRYLMDKNIKCLACGEPIWGTLEEAAKKRGFTNHDIENFVDDLNAMLRGKSRRTGD